MDGQRSSWVKRLQKLEQTSDALAPLPLHSMLSLNGSRISKSRRASASSLYSQLFGSRFWIVILDLGYMLKGKAGGLSIFTAFWIMIVPLVFHFSTVTALQKGISFPCWLKGHKSLKGSCGFSLSTLLFVTLILKTYPSHIFYRRFWQIPNFRNGTWLQIIAIRLYPTSMYELIDSIQLDFCLYFVNTFCRAIRCFWMGPKLGRSCPFKSPARY